MTVRAVIVDDEPLARQLLREMLEAVPDVAVVAEHGDGAAAVEGILADPPDVVFLDVRMPALDGFQVVAALPPERRPVVVFVTAFDEYALRAFEVEAADYLLKPFDEERLGRTLARVRRRIAASGAGAPGNAGIEGERLLDLLQRLAQRAHQVGAPRRLVVKEEERTLFVPVARIDWLEAAGKHVKVHAGSDVHTMRDSLTRLAEELALAGFVRISRSAVVNGERIREVHPWFHGDHLVVLANGDRVPTTRGFRAGLTELLESR